MLIELALNEQDKGDLYIGETERRMEGSPEKIKCLIGPKGCGKTFFLNYLFSKFSPILDSKGVIWVRLNLLEEFGDDKDILHRIYAQATKIIMRYYDPESAEFKQKKIPIPAGQSLQLYIERSKFPAQHKKGLLDEVEGMRDVFYTKKREEPLSPALVSKSLGRKVFNLARDNGYSYIIVFYGLDRMEATSQHDKRFRSLVNQVANLALNASVGARALWPPSRRLPCSHLQPDLADRGRSC
jgi:hypothetical protein